MRILVSAPVALGLVIAGHACAGSLTVEVENVEPGGTVLVAICRNGLGEGFCREGQDAPGTGQGLRFDFAGLDHGPVAVAAYEDMNGNGRLDRTPLGLPLEPFGFSNGAGRDGRPDFPSARFTLNEHGGTVRVRLGRILGR